MPYSEPMLLADTVPPAEVTGGSAGTLSMATRAGHAHPRLTSAGGGTLNASGEFTITFTRSFAVVPCVDFTYIEVTDNPPVVFKVKSWVQDGSLNYVGCVAKGYRSQTIPTNLVTLLLGGVFNIFAGSATGVVFTYIALQPS